MAHIPETVRVTELFQHLQASGLKLLAQGKVRDTFELPNHPELLLPVVTDRVSAFDIVMPVTVPFKGEVLNALAVMWFIGPLKDFPNHLVAYGADIDRYLPAQLRGNKELWARAIVVQKLEMAPYEAVVRQCLTGTALKEYKRNLTADGAIVWGHWLPAGLHDGAPLPEAILTPTTKAQDDHDIPIDISTFRQNYGLGSEKLALKVFEAGSAYALSRGFMVADTKFEFSDDLIIGDEVFTPDSSRFWRLDDWRNAEPQRTAPVGFDKQPIRDYLSTLATPFADESGRALIFSQLSPKNRDHLQWVNTLQVGTLQMSKWAARYLQCFEMLTGQSLKNFQRERLGIAEQ